MRIFKRLYRKVSDVLAVVMRSWPPHAFRFVGRTIDLFLLTALFYPNGCIGFDYDKIKRESYVDRVGNCPIYYEGFDSLHYSCVNKIVGSLFSDEIGDTMVPKVSPEERDGVLASNPPAIVNYYRIGVVTGWSIDEAAIEDGWLIIHKPTPHSLHGFQCWDISLQVSAGDYKLTKPFFGSILKQDVHCFETDSIVVRASCDLTNVKPLGKIKPRTYKVYIRVYLGNLTIHGTSGTKDSLSLENPNRQLSVGPDHDRIMIGVNDNNGSMCNLR